jgi:hypothetical protein
VAIWGSCVTRDAFAVPDQVADWDLLYYGARSSWVSQASRRWPDAEPALDGTVSGFGRRMVAEDLAKSVVDRLIEHRPQVVVFDLIDERLALLRRGQTWVTCSEYLAQTDLGAALAARPDATCGMTAPRRAVRFARAVRRLAPRLLRGLPDTTFVLHLAPYTGQVAGGGRLPEPQAGWARELDAAQQPMFDALAGAFGRRLVRAVPPPAVCLVDPRHRWGPASYHYVPQYYDWLLDALRAVPPVPTASSLPARSDKESVGAFRGSAAIRRRGHRLLNRG